MTYLRNIRRRIRRLKQQQADQQQAQKTGLPLIQWAQRFLENYLSCDLSELHTYLAGQLDRLTSERNGRLNVVAPRGSAKSTWSTFAWPIYLILEHQEPYLVLTADTGPQARKYLYDLRNELEDNDALKENYNYGQGRTWNENQLELSNGCLIEALGTGSKIRGRRHRGHRPTTIIVDDPQNKDHIISQLQRDRSWEWLTKDVLTAGEPGTNIVVCGTALHPECIVQRLLKTPGWTSKVFRSIIQWPERMDLWKEWELILCNYDLETDERERRALAFYHRNKTEMDK